jgi:hypothetical protein
MSQCCHFCAILWDDTGHRQGASVDLQPDKVRSDTFSHPALIQRQTNVGANGSEYHLRFAHSEIRARRTDATIGRATKCGLTHVCLKAPDGVEWV